MSAENFDLVNKDKISVTFSGGSKSMVTERTSLGDACLSENKIDFPLMEEKVIETISDIQNDVDDESDECGEQYLRIRKTPSFRCFIKVEMSNSSLFRSKLYNFPPLEDPGIDEIYLFQEPSKSYDNVGVEKYEDLCKDLQIFPFNSVKKELCNATLNLKFYVLTPKQMKAVCQTLAGNAYVRNLILEGNQLNIEQVDMLKNMMEENTAITYINLRHCQIGEEGAKHLNDGIAASQVLIELDLSHNSLGDKGFSNIIQGLCETPCLVKLDISNNQLTEECAEALEFFLLENNALEEINLSWNCLNTGPICKRVFRAILSKDILKKLVLAWNGLATVPAVSPIARYVTLSEVLEYLDISHNRLSGPPLNRIRRAILKNKSLVSVKIGNNPFPPDQAYFVASLLTAKAKDPLEYLDMENIWFTKEILQLFPKVRDLGKRIMIGGVLSNYSIKGPNVNELLFKRCRYLLMKPKKKKARIDFGHFILSLPDEIITKQDYESLLKKKKIKRLDKDLIAELMNRFLVKKTKVDCKEMKKQYMEHWPDTTLPPPKPKKAKKGKKKKKIKKTEEELAIHEMDIQTETPVAQEQPVEPNSSVEHSL